MEETIENVRPEDMWKKHRMLGKGCWELYEYST